MFSMFRLAITLIERITSKCHTNHPCRSPKWRTLLRAEGKHNSTAHSSPQAEKVKTLGKVSTTGASPLLGLLPTEKGQWTFQFSSCLSSVLRSCLLRTLAIQHLSVCTSELRPRQYFFTGQNCHWGQGSHPTSKSKRQTNSNPSQLDPKPLLWRTRLNEGG